MYDFEILVPAETENQVILTRIKDFKKWGLLNTKNLKIKLVLAASKDNDSELLLSGWQKGIDVDVLVTPHKHVSQRINHYYSSYIKPNTAKWYLRIDEDSITDISGLYANLERMFDWEREYHITGEVNHDVQAVEYSILKAIGYEWWYEDKIGPAHEFEISITSNAAISRMLKNEDAKSYFNLRQQFADGYGDHGLSFAVRMEKIYHTICNFVTWTPDISNFSLFGGKYNHIHHVGRDMCSIIPWLEIRNDPKDNPLKNEKLFINRKKDINSKRLIEFKDDHTVIFQKTKLEEDLPDLKDGQFLSLGKKEKLGLWDVTNDNKLTIFFTDKKPFENIIFERLDEFYFKSELYEIKK